jgi:hypothetical protein
MTTSRIDVAAIALSIAFGSVGAVGSTPGSTKEQKLSGTIAPSARLADGSNHRTALKLWQRQSSALSWVPGPEADGSVRALREGVNYLRARDLRLIAPFPR